jgi:hypothetical protein
MDEIENLNQQINELLLVREGWMAKATKCTTSFSDTPKGSGGEDARELAYCEIADLDTKINALIDKLVELKQNHRRCAR